MNREKQKSQKLSFSRKWLIASAIIAVAYSVSLFIPLISPFSWYPIKTLQCGQRPVIASRFAASNTYSTPKSKFYGPAFFDDPQLYFCTEQQAKAAGYRPGLGE